MAESINKTAIGNYKVFNPNTPDPDFYRPRGNMFTYESYGYNFGGADTGEYPTSGVNLARGGAAAPGHGIYVVPKANQVIYINGIKIIFNHTAKSLFLENYKDRVDDAEETIQFMHNGSSNCECSTPFCLTRKSDEAPMEVADALANSEYLYTQSMPLECPGRFDGDEGDSFGFRASGGNGLYLGASFAANKLTHLYFQFTGWVVDKIDIEGVKYEVIPR